MIENLKASCINYCNTGNCFYRKKAIRKGGVCMSTVTSFF